MRYLLIFFLAVFSVLVLSLDLAERLDTHYQIYKSAADSAEQPVPFVSSILPMHDCADHSTSASLKYIPEFNPNTGLEVLMPNVEQVLPYCPIADGFDMPVGAPHGQGYYIAQIFGKNKHMGEDWNAKGGSHLDFGKPVYAVANGVVHWSVENKGSWGNFIRLIHNAGTEDSPRYIETFYAHLDEMYVNSGDVVSRGQVIGTIGDANGKYNPHLHLELKLKVGTEVGRGYGEDPRIAGHIPPYPFLISRRPHKYIPGR